MIAACNSLGHLFSIRPVEQVLSLFCKDTFMALIAALFECLSSTLLKTSCWNRKIWLSLFYRWSAEIFGDLPIAKLEIRGRVRNKTWSSCLLLLLTDNTAFLPLQQLWTSSVDDDEFPVSWFEVLLLPVLVFNFCLCCFKTAEKSRDLSTSNFISHITKKKRGTITVLLPDLQILNRNDLMLTHVLEFQ